jgi:hypothetical protein
MQKAEVTLDGIALAGAQAITWKLITGVQPYSTVMSVHESDWPKLKQKKGQPLTLSITDSRGRETTIEKVYILHEAPSDSPHRVSFVVADRRWQWAYSLVARDFNMTRKTGTKTVSQGQLPENQVNADTYDYLAYSLNDDGTKWTAQQAVIEVLRILEDVGDYRIDSFPTEGFAGSTRAQLTLQNVSLRDQGDIALARVLAFVPGAEVYVNVAGEAVVFNGTDLAAAQTYLDSIQQTWNGDRAAQIDRRKIRPKKIIVNYVREIECLFSYSDDYGPTQASPNRNEPFLENVLPTVDLKTTISEYDPQADRVISKDLAPGNWIRVDKWLDYVNTTIDPADSGPWTFENIRHFWTVGGLEAVLGAQGNGVVDQTKNANGVQRVQALRENLRQTMRINRRYMERIRDIRPVRAALLDPVTGARAPAAVWGQICVVPSAKGQQMAAPVGANAAGYTVTRNVDYLLESQQGTKKLVETTPGPQRVDIVDEELGIFRLETIASPYGITGAMYPCFLVDANNVQAGISRDLSLQDRQPTGAGFRVESTATGISLSNTLKCKVMLTIVPAAPNGTLQFHRIEVTAADVRPLFKTAFPIQDGEGPELEVFVPPSEITARFAWQDDATAANTLQKLLGLTDNVDDALIGAQATLPGFLLVNHDPGIPSRHLAAHAQALAAELYAHFADSVQGDVVSAVPSTGMKLVGNMDSVAIRVGQFPSAKVDAAFSFPGRQRPISRFALMPDSVRQLVLKIVDSQ